MTLLLPADVLRPRRVDEHFAGEFDAARRLGHEVALIDHDALAGDGDRARAVARVPEGGIAFYRGWMLSADAYAGLAEALSARGTRLRTDAARYRRAHELPGWYAALSAFTPASTWTVGADRDGFDVAAAALGAGAAVVRDYSKSMKHYWDEAAYIPDLADTARAWAVARRLHELRGDDFTGGFVLRRYEPFTGPEVRTWWVDGACRLVTAHPDTPDQAPPGDLDVAVFAPAVAAVGLPFVTVDLARRTDGAWRIVELGDGQVSDRPTSTPPEDLVGVLPWP
ncbi:ATP-grasp domain-containing protein [Cryptosporangium japonicum]|uniref:ATP-grasp domain-containing protein n=1 Tax=Cryptosporangium japonicum TaxID=80872 RepID=A0ABN0TIM5_9ACTN